MKTHPSLLLYLRHAFCSAARSRSGLSIAALVLLCGGVWFYHLRHAEVPGQVVVQAEAEVFEGEVTTPPPLSVVQAMEVIALGTEFPATAEQSWAEAAPEEEFAAFQAWAGRWAAAAPAEREGLAPEG